MAGPRRIPGATWNISDDWLAHRRRGSSGGTDYTDAYGTTMHAMAGGFVVAVDNSPDGSGGRMITILHDDGDKTEELHSAGFNVARGQRVEWGSPLGLSGGSGFGQDRYYGSHIHVHGIDTFGRRYDLQPYVVGGLAAPAGTPSSPITQGDPDMPKPTLYRPNAGPAKGYGLAVSPGRFAISSGGLDDQIWQADAGNYAECSADEINSILSMNGIPWTVLEHPVGGFQWSDSRPVDSTSIAAAIKAGLADVEFETPELDDADVERLALAVQTKLVPQFTALPDAVVDELGKDAARLRD